MATNSRNSRTYSFNQMGKALKEDDRLKIYLDLSGLVSVPHDIRQYINNEMCVKIHKEETVDKWYIAAKDEEEMELLKAQLEDGGIEFDE